VVADWTLALFFKREIVSLWSMHEPFNEFQVAAGHRPTKPQQPRESHPAA